MKGATDYYGILCAHEQKRCAPELERVLLEYGPALSPNDALSILNSLTSTYNVPFKSLDDLAGFYSGILSNVTKTRVRVELQSGILTISPPRLQSALREHTNRSTLTRPPFNAEYVLYLVLKREERDEVIGDLIEAYGNVVKRFDKRRADIWFYKQVVGSLFPLLCRALVRVGALVWLGRVLRRLIS